MNLYPELLTPPCLLPGVLCHLAKGLSPSLLPHPSFTLGLWDPDQAATPLPPDEETSSEKRSPGAPISPSVPPSSILFSDFNSRPLLSPAGKATPQKDLEVAERPTPPQTRAGSRPGCLGGAACVIYQRLLRPSLPGHPQLRYQLSISHATLPPPPRLICVLPLTSKVGSHPVHPTLCSSLSTPPQRRAFGQAGAPGGRGAVQPVCCEGRDFLSNSVLL